MDDLNFVAVSFDTLLKEYIARNLRFLRKQTKKKQSDVARVIGITTQAYAYYETAKREVNITNLKKLALYYGVSIDLITSQDLIGLSSLSTTNFPVYNLQADHSLVAVDLFSKIKNSNYSLWQVNIDKNQLKIFESSDETLPGLETMFTYRNTTYIGMVSIDDDGSGCFMVNGKTTFFKRSESKHLIVMGILLATINKNYDCEDFFSL